MEEGTQGKVYVSSIIEKEGSVTHAAIQKGIKGDGNACNDEALRVVRLLPQFMPGMMNGRPVRVKYILPITFKIH